MNSGLSIHQHIVAIFVQHVEEAVTVFQFQVSLENIDDIFNFSNLNYEHIIANLVFSKEVRKMDNIYDRK